MLPRYVPALALVIVHMGALGVRSQEFQTIAHWQFQNGANFLNDSSGNGYHLTVPDIAAIIAPAFSTDKPSELTADGSAQFIGNAFAQTNVPLQLSMFPWVRVSYWVKVEGTAKDQVLLENSFDTNFQVNPGSTMHIINPSGLPEASVLTGFRTGAGLPSAATPLDLVLLDALDVWQFIQVDYNFSDVAPADRIKLFNNNVEGETFRDTGVAQWSTLRDDTLYLGGRRAFAGDPALLFTGKIADLKIEAVPPATSPGDFNNDGDVDGADFLLWQRGESPNQVSSSDLDDWKLNFDAPLSAVAAVAAPEPTCLGMFCGSSLIGALIHWRRRRQ